MRQYNTANGAASLRFASFESIVAKQHVRIEIDVPGEGGRGWRRSASSIELDSQQDLGEAWRRDLQAGTAYMLQETLVKSNDAHMDAKVVRDSLKWNAPPPCSAIGPTFAAVCKAGSRLTMAG